MTKDEQCARARAVVAALNVAIEAVKEAERQAGATKVMASAEGTLRALERLQAKPLGICERMPRGRS